jgi:hypothetical protein
MSLNVREAAPATAKRGSLPSTVIESKYAGTEAMAASMKVSLSKSFLYGISKAKRIAVNGVLKVAAKPAAAPAMNSLLRRSA